ncbi:MAG TPA: patatin-like phospholipase family protein [Candidatus Sulfotelmatobacter sp.]|nr:patatin-like phospholipase family protein [Candidatus Sulfotelmatobacter sp.]
MKDRALVLGGGGVAGIAWMTGLLFGLSEQNLDLRQAEVTIGTSAGSTLGAQLGAASLQELFRRMVEPSAQGREIAPDPRVLESFQNARSSFSSIADRAERIRRIGKWALETPTVSESERHKVVEARLPVHTWPDHDLRIVAIDAEAGEIRVFDRNSGVNLIDAVAASCAVPGIWPPVTIHGRRYIDGGVRCAENADLAKGYARVVILSPMGTTLPRIGGLGLKEQVEVLQQEGGRTYLITPDAKSRRAIGPNPLSPETRRPAAKAGREQGQRIDADLAEFWKNGPG